MLRGVSILVARNGVGIADIDIVDGDGGGEGVEVVDRNDSPGPRPGVSCSLLCHTVAQCLIPEVGLWYELESSGVVEDELKVVTEMPMKWATIELRWIPMERTGAVSLIAVISSSHMHTSRYSTVPFLKHSGSLL